MITLKRVGEQFIMSVGDDELATIESLQKRYPRKIERHIEEYLKERKVNIREQENMLIMANMSDAERAKRLEEIEGRRDASSKEQNA